MTILNRCLVCQTLFRFLVSVYANQTDISTSAAVVELRFAYGIVVLALSLLSSLNLAALLLPFLVGDISFHPSAEGVASVYGSIG